MTDQARAQAAAATLLSLRNNAATGSPTRHQRRLFAALGMGADALQAQARAQQCPACGALQMEPCASCCAEPATRPAEGRAGAAGVRLCYTCWAEDAAAIVAAGREADV